MPMHNSVTSSTRHLWSLLSVLCASNKYKIVLYWHKYSVIIKHQLLLLGNKSQRSIHFFYTFFFLRLCFANAHTGMWINIRKKYCICWCYVHYMYIHYPCFIDSFFLLRFFEYPLMPCGKVAWDWATLCTGIQCPFVKDAEHFNACYIFQCCVYDMFVVSTCRLTANFWFSFLSFSWSVLRHTRIYLL